jgi:hypothetical protein
LDQTEAISPFPLHAAGAETSLAETVEDAREGVAVAEGGDEAKVETVPADTEAVVDANGEGQGEPVAVNVPTDPNAEARDAITGVGTPGGESTLEDLVFKPAAKPVSPSGAPEISALPAEPEPEPEPENVVKMPGGFDPLTQRTPIAAPVREAAPADETGEEKVADPIVTPRASASPPQSVNMTGLPGPSSLLVYPTAPEPPAAEPQIPVAPAAPAPPVAEPPAPVAPAEPAPAEELVPQSESTVETEDPTKVVDEFLAIDPATIIKASDGMVDRSSFLLAAQYRDAQIHIRNMRESGRTDMILAPVVKDYKNALEAQSGEAS